MRLNPDFFKDPDPETSSGIDPEQLLEDMFKVVNTLDDLPKEKIEELDQLSERITEILDHEDAVNPGRNAIVRYLAFQELQIHGLQLGIHQIHQMLLMLAQAVDTKEDKGHVENN